MEFGGKLRTKIQSIVRRDRYFRVCMRMIIAVNINCFCSQKNRRDNSRFQFCLRHLCFAGGLPTFKTDESKDWNCLLDHRHDMFSLEVRGCVYVSRYLRPRILWTKSPVPWQSLSFAFPAHAISRPRRVNGQPVLATVLHILMHLTSTWICYNDFKTLELWPRVVCVHCMHACLSMLLCFWLMTFFCRIFITWTPTCLLARSSTNQNDGMRV